jgi:hypothetical protein
MLKQDVLRHFGGKASAVARILKISRAAVSKWPEVVPWYAAGELEEITGGALKRDEALYVRGRIALPLELRHG